MLSQTQDTKNKWGIHKGCLISHLAQKSVFGFIFQWTDVFVHKKTLGCYTDLSLQNCHFESKTSATILRLYCFHFLSSNYTISERWSPCNVACCLGKKTVASEWNTSECNILCRKLNISVLCNIHLLTQYPQKMTPTAFPRQDCLNTYIQCSELLTEGNQVAFWLSSLLGRSM